MAFEFFGISFGKKSAPNMVQNLPSPVAPSQEDGATTVYNASSYFGVSYLDFDVSFNNDNELIRRYRTIAGYSVIDIGIENIINESIVYNDGVYPVKLNLDNLPVTRKMKTLLLEEFANILKLLKFDVNAYQIFRKWYIDGRIYFAIITDEKKPELGILELRPIDPLKIKKIRQVNKEQQNGVDIITSIEEYYLYNDSSLQNDTYTIQTKNSINQSIKFNKDSIICINSGQIDYTTNNVIGYLNKAIRPANQLRMLEDAVVIYKLTRAPERRIFYIDVGNLPKIKADEYLRDVMQRYRNKVVYDGTTGEVKDDRKFSSMLEDYWMPRRGDSKGTQIDTLQGSNPGFTDMIDVEYFKRELYRALNVPFSRLQSESGFNMGRSSEISRDEVNFQKFIQRLQKKFSELFLQALETQLILKKIIAPNEFSQYTDYMYIEFLKDNYFEELKTNEILISRIEAATDLQPFIGRYYSNAWVRKHIFKQTDEEMELMDFEIEQEFQNPIYYPPIMDDGAPMTGGSDGSDDGSMDGEVGGNSGGSSVMTMADVQHTMSKTINQVAQGASITIKRGGKPVAKLIPAGANESLLETFQSSKINNIQYLIDTMQVDESIIINDMHNSIILKRV
jgi:antitoxin (DNA-binding transcriptional repressor) of toxin-antitoxin stability system